MNKFIIVLLGVFVLASCEKQLNIEPEQDLSVEGAFSDEKTTRASLEGVYSKCQDLEVFGSMPQIINDYMADNVNFIGSFPTLEAVDNYSTLSDNSTIEGIFRDNYEVILAANAVIAFTGDVDDLSFTDDEKRQVVAEATFLRALVNFNLVNLFAQPYSLDNGASQGIVLELLPEILTEGHQAKTRSTVSQVYDQIEKDLIAARDNIEDSADKTRASSGAASALLSRLYLYKGDYQAAADAAEEVLSNPFYEMANDYNFYNGSNPGGGTSEDVFALYMSEIDNSRTGTGGWAEYYNPSDKDGRGDCPFAQDLLDAFAEEPGDLRMAMTQVGSNGMTYTTKFPDATNHTDNAPIIRTTEIALNRAEALAQLNGVDVEALAILNDVRERAGIPTRLATFFSSGQELVDAILVERRKELCFEGHRRMDLLRVGKELREGNAATAPGANKVVMPIPQFEIDLGSSLPQNAGY